MTEITYQYPEDLTGESPDNLIPNEYHLITSENTNTYDIIIPKFAPFFTTNLVVKNRVDGQVNELNDVLDYTLILPYEAGSRGLGKHLYGGISIHNQNISGELSLEYQTIGGKWLTDINAIHQRFADKVYNPRTAYWDQVIGPNEIFPPDQHRQDFNQVHGQQELITVIMELVNTLSDPSRTSNIVNHFVKNNNPHNVTKDQIGLGNVDNWKLSNKDQVIDMVKNDTLITPDSLQKLVESISETYYKTSRGLKTEWELYDIPIEDNSDNPYSLNTIALELQERLNRNQPEGVDSNIITDTVTHRKLSKIMSVISYKESLNDN